MLVLTDANSKKSLITVVDEKPTNSKRCKTQDLTDESLENLVRHGVIRWLSNPWVFLCIKNLMGANGPARRCSCLSCFSSCDSNEGSPLCPARDRDPAIAIDRSRCRLPGDRSRVPLSLSGALCRCLLWGPAVVCPLSSPLPFAIVAALCHRRCPLPFFRCRCYCHRYRSIRCYLSSSSFRRYRSIRCYLSSSSFRRYRSIRCYLSSSSLHRHRPVRC
jgi:hypothetical protein